jgi:hypothetical protein
MNMMICVEPRVPALQYMVASQAFIEKTNLTLS